MSNQDYATVAWPDPVIVVTHAAMLEHRTGDHDDDPARLTAAWRGIEAAARDGIHLVRRESRPADAADILRAHEPRYLERLHDWCRSGSTHAGHPDCPLSPGTWDAVLHAAGAGRVAVDAIAASDRSHRAFCAVRPPGHHAGRAAASGYCYLNNVVITARHALDAGRAERVLIIDLDFHHGDGTEAMVRDDPRLAYVSVHADPARHFPGTGQATRTPRLIDAPMSDRGDGPWLAAVRGAIDAMRAFTPDLVLVSFGTDALRGDPVGDLGISQDALAAGAQAVIDTWPLLPIISLLEGGYDPEALSEAVRRHIRVLATPPPSGTG